MNDLLLIIPEMTSKMCEDIVVCRDAVTNLSRVSNEVLFSRAARRNFDV